MHYDDGKLNKYDVAFVLFVAKYGFSVTELSDNDYAWFVELFWECELT